MRGIKIGGGRYKKTKRGKKENKERRKGAGVATHTKDNHKKASVKNRGREEIRTKELSVPVVSDFPAVF